MRGEGWGEGLFFYLGQQRFEDPVDVLDNVVPDAQDPITEGRQIGVALLIGSGVRVLPTIKFNDQAPVTAGEVDIVRTDWLLADKFEPAKLPTPNPHRSKISFAPHPRPLPASGAREYVTST